MVSTTTSYPEVHLPSVSFAVCVFAMYIIIISCFVDFNLPVLGFVQCLQIVIHQYCLLQPEFKSMNEERIYGYLVCMIGNMNVNEGHNLLRFVTGSSVCSSTGITITFNSLSGLGRRPIPHTCDCVLELPSTYMNYDDFYNEFLSYLIKSTKSTLTELIHFEICSKNPVILF